MLAYLKESFHAVGEFQSRIILTAFYFIILPIFSVIAKWSSDALGLKGYKQPSTWIQRPKPEHTLAEAQRQY